MWYPISYIATGVFLILWFYFSVNERRAYTFRQLSLLSFVFYVVTVAIADVEWSQKLAIYSKDLLLLGSVAAFFGLIRRQKALFWILFLALLGIALTFYWEELNNRLPEPSQKKVELDKNGEFLIELKDKNSVRRLVEVYDLTLLKAFDVDEASSPLTHWYTIDVPEQYESNLSEIKIELNKLGVSFEENELITVAPMPARELPKINKKFGINDPGLEHMWGFEAMEIDRLYGLLKQEKISPKKKAKIAILDTGVDAKHEDLKANYITTKAEYDSDGRGHGTHCAGIAAAVSNNGLGAASFSPNSKFIVVTSVKVLNNYGMGTQKTIINGMIEAAKTGVDVISMSLGGYSNDSRQKAYSQAVEYCNQNGSIVVVAAGNSSMNAKNFSPANATGAIAVSAIDTKLNSANFSNFISDLEMGIAAPGVSIYSTIPNNQYASYNGTSMATPYVSGLIGLMRSINPSLTTAEVYNILEQTGRNTQDTNLTGKLILPHAAIAEVLRLR